MVNIEAFNLNEDFMQYIDYDNVDDLAMGLRDDSRLVVGLISTCSTPSIGKKFQPHVNQTYKHMGGIENPINPK